jgi:hypothetical protein
MSSWIHVPVGLKVVEVMWVVHTALPTHILNNTKQYEKMEGITDMKEWRKKKNHEYYRERLHLFIQRLNLVIEEQKSDETLSSKYP